MLSYRHAFHAGNHADVLKHYLLHLALDYFNQKDKPYWVIDTHAGAGMYALNDAFAAKNAEYETGIARLLNATALPKNLAEYVATVASFNHDTSLRYYPGSPKLAERLLRADDKLRLFELHPSDYQLLTNNFDPKKRQTKIEMLDGFVGIKACLPPATKRALILLDPPYELKDDYLRVLACVQDSLKRFSMGTYLIWYPLLQRPEPALLIQQLQQLGLKNWLNVTLTVQSPSATGFGMHGSGMFVINPPWTMPTLLKETLPTLTHLLAIDQAASFSLYCHIT